LLKKSLSLWERAGVRGEASERGIECSVILRYPSETPLTLSQRERAQDFFSNLLDINEK
jgi:hypothetical protein